MSVFAGIDLGGTYIKAALASADAATISQASWDTETHGGPDHVIDRMAGLVETLMTDTQSEDLVAVGVGMPGLVDIASGESKFLPNFPTQWRDIPVASQLQRKLDCNVRLLNDVRTATLGELKFGHGRGRDDITFAFFSLGTGVGGGVVIDGDLRLGPLGAAGELGHQTILPDGPRCGCGNRGCLETLASGPAIAAEGVRLMRMGLAPYLHELTDGQADLVTTREMATASAQDESIREAVERAAQYIGVAAANVVSVLHPDMIVLGGGVALLGEVLVNGVREAITNRVGMFPTDNVEVVLSKLGDQAGVSGAIALAMQST